MILMKKNNGGIYVLLSTRLWVRARLFYPVNKIVWAIIFTLIELLSEQNSY